MAAWVAAIGAALVLAAAGVLVVGQWNHIRPEIKLAGLVAANAAVASVAALARRRLPAVSRAVAHLAAMMTVPSGVAVMAAVHETWPVAIAVGGACGLVACAVQSRRWTAPLLEPAAEVAAVIGLAGVAALLDAPLGILVAGAAVVAFVGRRSMSAARLAALAVAVPVLAVFGALGIGPGTTVRLGARGDVLGWAAPVAGGVAALVYAALAQRRRHVAYVGLSVVAALTGAATGMAVLRATPALWLGAVAAAGLGLVTVAETLRRGDDAAFAPVARLTVRAVSIAVTAAGVIAVLPLAVVVSVPRTDAALAWALSVWAALAAVSAAVTMRGAPADVPAVGLRLSAATLGLVALTLATGAWTAPLAVAVALVLVAVAARTSVAEQYTLAAWVGVAVTGVRWHEASAWCVAASVAAVVTATTVTASRRWAISRATRPLGWDEAIVLMVGAGAAAAGAWPVARWAPTVLFGAAALVALVAGRRSTGAGLVAAGAMAATLAGVGFTTGAAVGWVLGAVAVTLAAGVVESVPAFAVAAIGATAGSVVFAVAQPEQGLVSVAGVLVGAQAALYGYRRARQEYLLLGGAVSTASLLSLPVTSGALRWLLDTLAPHGITGTDLAVAGLAVGLVAFGIWLRRQMPTVSSWIAYGPALAVSGAHLLTTQAATGEVGRIAVAIGVGVVAVAVGGWRRLAAPLLAGPALIATSAIMASGHQLASLPVWVWLAVGGTGLLVVAALIEWRSPDTDAGAPAEPLLRRLRHQLH